jgi:hypothetical protein
MKKVFIGLLIIAAGAAAYFLLQKKNNQSISASIKKDQLTGKWKLDSLWSLTDTGSHLIKSLFDPKQQQHYYDFSSDGTIRYSMNDSLTADSATYDLQKDNQLLWKEFPSDTAGTLFKISLPDRNSMQLQSKDSSILLFIKAVK